MGRFRRDVLVAIATIFTIAAACGVAEELNMPSNYTGVTTGITPADTVVISEPVDTDQRNSASVRTPMERLADFLEYLMRNAGILSSARTWTAKQTMSGGVGGLPAPTADYDAETRKTGRDYADAQDIAQVTLPQLLTLGTGWTAASGAEPRWWSDRSGIVHLNGRATPGGGATNLIATLPVAARPGTDQWVRGTSNAGASLAPVGVVVGAVGEITTPLIVGDTVALDGISFYPGY